MRMSVLSGAAKFDWDSPHPRLGIGSICASTSILLKRIKITQHYLLPREFCISINCCCCAACASLAF